MFNDMPISLDYEEISVTIIVLIAAVILGKVFRSHTKSSVSNNIKTDSGKITYSKVFGFLSLTGGIALGLLAIFFIFDSFIEYSIILTFPTVLLLLGAYRILGKRLDVVWSDKLIEGPTEIKSIIDYIIATILPRKRRKINWVDVVEVGLVVRGSRSFFIKDSAIVIINDLSGPPIVFSKAYVGWPILIDAIKNIRPELYRIGNLIDFDEYN